MACLGDVVVCIKEKHKLAALCLTWSSEMAFSVASKSAHLSQTHVTSREQRARLGSKPGFIHLFLEWALKA